MLYLRTMKKALKSLVVAVLAWQVKRLRSKNQFKIVGVVGSMGKTSTKLAIAQTLEKTLKVRYQEGNYNDIVTVPLIFFGLPEPSLFNPFAWLKTFIVCEKQIKNYPYEVVVVELGTDTPGQIAEFKKYLELDIAVVTAVAPEHMEFFGDLKSVADEELSVAGFSKKIVYNADLVDAEYSASLPEGSVSYGIEKTEVDYRIANIFHSAAGLEGDIKTGNDIYLHVAHEVVSETQLYSLLAAVVVGKELELKPTEILAGLSAIRPVSGRLRRLRGLNGSMIIDDTYNSSPEAVKAGLNMLYKLEAPQKVAILGNMNELGSMSESAHKEIGEMCDPNQLAMVITIGPDANKYLAQAAKDKGCNVNTFDDPNVAGEFLQSKIESGAVIFAKGSQNKVFAEEAIKKLLADPEDASKLVRQSPYWLKRKEASFKK